MRAHALQPSYWWDWFIASDPALARLKMGLRAMLGMGLSLVAVAGLGRLLQQPMPVALIGVMMGQLASINVQDPLPRQQRITLLSAIPVAVATVCLASVSAASLWGSALVFLLVIFLAVFSRRFGPRGLALGMIAVMLFFMALFFHVSIAQLPWVSFSVAVGGFIAYGVRVWLVPDRPDASLRRTFAAFRRSLSLLLADLSDVLDLPGERQRVALIRRTAGRLHDAALMVEQHLESANPERLMPGLRKAELRSYLLELELTAGRLVFAIYRCLKGPLPPGTLHALQARLAAFRYELRASSKVRAHETLVPGAIPGGAAVPPSASAALTIEASLDRLRALLTTPPTSRAGASRAQDEAAAVRELETHASEPAPSQIRPSTRQAIQATVACGLAIWAGHLVSSTRWYWAVIASFVIFNRASTQGDILLRAWHRILGTVIGVLAGLLLANKVSGHRDLELSLVVGCVFLGFYLLQVSYAWMVFWFTTLVSVLYSLMGRYSPGILYMRVWETLIGAGIGAVVAAVLLPSRTRVRVQKATAETLHSVASFLEAAATLPGSTAVEHVREIDGKLREVREAAHPLTARLLLTDRHALRLVHTLSALIFYVRQLAPACSRIPADADRIHMLESRLAENARIVASSAEGEGTGTPVPFEGALQSARQSLATSEGGDSRSLPRVLHWLERIDVALLEVHESLAGFRSRRRLA